MQRIQELKKNPPRILPEHRAGAKRLLDQHNAHEIEKERDIARERKALAKDVASFAFNHTVGIGQIFHGIGEGKKNKCHICEEHKSQMFNMKDNQWYCSEHRWFGELNEEEKEKELLCLKTKEMNR